LSYNRNPGTGYVRGSKRKKSPSPLIPIIVIAIGIIAAAGFLVYSLFFGPNRDSDSSRTMPNMEEVNFFDHPDNHHLTPGRTYFIINGEIITTQTAPTFIDGRLFIPADFLRAYVDRYIFWEQDTRRLTITTIDEVMRFTPDETTYTINWQPQPLPDPIREIAGMAYMSADMVMTRYPVTIVHQEEYGFVIIDLHRYQRRIYNIVEATDEDGAPIVLDEDDFIPLRFGANDQHPIMARLHLGDRVVNLGIAPHEEDDDIFYRVQAENGLVGYVSAENTSFSEQIAAVPQTEQRRPITRPSFDGPVNLVWHLVTNHASAAHADNWYTMQGVNAISPTWLYFCRPSYDGTIINFGNQQFVNWAHNNGMEVWPMISDAFFSAETGPENFTNEAARLALMDANIRDYIIDQLIDMIIRYNWDGINIDYEAVRPPEGEHFIQFLRELSVPMRQIGAVLSVAVFSPIPDNHWWNYPEIAMASDFVVIMAYDEHYASIGWPGSVSSFPFVQNAVLNMLDLGVPSEQVVTALPTYMRIWVEQFNPDTGAWELLPPGPGGNPLPEFYPHRRMRAVGMAFGRSYMEGRGGEYIWDYTQRQYVSTIYFTHGDIEMRTSAWLNCLRSTSEKLTLYHQHNLGGVAWWRQGLELNPALWIEVDRILNQ